MAYKYLSRILKHLKDAQWHGIDEIKKVVALPLDRLNVLVDLLHDTGFIQVKDERIRITQRGLRFLEF